MDRFAAAGAALVISSGPPRGSAARAWEVLANHDNHLHVRLPPSGPP